MLGELALLTGEQRSATVRARRDTTLLEIPRAAFEEVLATDPSAARFVLGQVAEQLRTAGRGTGVGRPQPGRRRCRRPSVGAARPAAAPRS